MPGCLIIGNGGREHALAWKVAQSKLVDQVFISPGNGCAFPDADIDPNASGDIVYFCNQNDIGLVIVGPEAQLSRGIVNEVQSSVAIFGPTKAGAMLETSKVFAKNFMRQYDLPTARFNEFSTISEVQHFISNCNWNGVVVKADGLAAGKGVIVAENKEEAFKAASRMLNGEFGDSGKHIVLEEQLSGYEVSALCFVDGKNFQRMPLVKDHKRLLDDDKGPNTGGMGVIGPIAVPSHVENEINMIIRKTIDGLLDQGIVYKGVLYVGLMITTNGPKILEYNCRFGDPETQILMRLLKSDLYNICLNCINGCLQPIEWNDRFACGIVLSSQNYPYSGDKGTEISNIPKSSDDVVTFHAGTARIHDKLVTNGGRILCVTSLGLLPASARTSALAVCEKIQFSGKFFRKDIGSKYEEPRIYDSISYSDSGVDINEGNQFVENIKLYIQRTMKPGMNQIGGFGAVVDLPKCGFSGDIQLVLGIDGVGTKIEIADQVNNYRYIGYDVVGMCVNDVLCHGAVPLAFLDYYVCGHLRREQAQAIVQSISEACIEAGCTLVGGETAEMPGVYGNKQWDLAGCAVAVRQSNWPLLPLSNSIEPGDMVIGLTSNGLHSNGFSLVRKVFSSNRIDFSTVTPWSNKTFGEELLSPTKIYVRQLIGLLKEGKIKGCAHITGGGIIENSVRVLNSNGQVALEVDASSWDKPAIFHWLASMGPIENEEMLKTFNCGIGMILIVSPCETKNVLSMLEASHEQPKIIGKVIPKRDNDLIKVTNLANSFTRISVEKRKQIRVAILISGNGTNMMKLIENSQKPTSRTEVVLVISNKADAKGLTKAQQKGIRTIVIPHTKIREEGDLKLSEALQMASVELICLAGYMRLLSADFVQKWRNRIINIHPSLLPSFKGARAVNDALSFGCKITGCTVHYVDEELDHGPIVMQSPVEVAENETVDSLHEKIQEKEHELFPLAMQYVAEKLLL
ncbi:unnamed protein product [Auanema sp. JU1783]|nr:unnamed protein product [Auanema sp. JU1783]